MAFSYFGGKNMHLPWLLPNLKSIPAMHFVDLFAGSAAVALNMNNPIITINDINKDVINFFRVLRDFPEQLITELELTPYSQVEYKEAWAEFEINAVKRARNFYVRVMQSFGSTGVQKEYNSWSFSVNSTTSRISSHVAKWLKGVSGLTSIVEKLKEFQIECRDFEKVIETYDSKDTLIYADPPYVLDSRTGNIRYAFDFKDDDHRRLADKLRNCSSFVAVSGYRCELLDELYKGFYISMDRYKRTNNPQSKRQECLYTNYNPKQGNLTLF